MRKNTILWRSVIIGGWLFFTGATNTAAQTDNEAFARWVQDFRAEAVRDGIPESIFDAAFADVQFNESVIRLDRKQPEGSVTFSDYLASTVSEKRVEQGRALLAEHSELLKEVSERYGVQPNYIVALWGIETSYGANTGNYSLIESLATLAYEGRRATFFRAELLNALQILAQEQQSVESFTGSWAGAMGNCQFMPSSYLRFAVDWDKDGHRDIWNSLPDTFASIARYLSESGWNGSISWGREVMFPENFSEAEADLTSLRGLKEWSARGLTLPGGDPLPDEPLTAYAMYPGAPWEGAYLVSSNFKVLLRWNRSRYFATSVGTLADRIGEEG